MAYSQLPDKKNPVWRGTLIGILVGFVIFLIVFVLGTSFASRVDSTHVTIDFLWQLIEQGVSGMVVGYVFYYIEQREMLFD